MSSGQGPQEPARTRRLRRSSFGIPRVRPRSVIITVIGFILAGLIGASSYFWPAITTALGSTGHRGDLPVQSPVTGANNGAAAGAVAAAPNSPFTVLLLGSDNDGKFQPGQILTQSMILVRVDPASNQVTMFSIPRDLYVDLSTGGTDKIDKAYLYGGANAAIATVQANFRVHVDHYVWIGLLGLVKLIDEVGGVDVVTTHPVLDDYYPADLTSGNPYDYSRVAVLGGAQHLDGLHAMEYVRSRHGDKFSDLGRAQRQQQVLVALRSKTEQLRLPDIPNFVQALSGEFNTDLSVTELGPLVGLAKKITPDQTHHVFLLPPQIADAQRGGQDVLIPDWPAILPLVHQSFPET